MKHLDTRLLWLQDLVRERQLIVEKVPTLVNPADLLTKHMSKLRHHALSDLMGLVDERNRTLSGLKPLGTLDGELPLCSAAKLFKLH
eukprot:6953509-Heterocapsa_arctica.AAC.1